MYGWRWDRSSQATSAVKPLGGWFRWDSLPPQGNFKGSLTCLWADSTAIVLVAVLQFLRSGTSASCSNRPVSMWLVPYKGRVASSACGDSSVCCGQTKAVAKVCIKLIDYKACLFKGLMMHLAIWPNTIPAEAPFTTLIKFEFKFFWKGLLKVRTQLSQIRFVTSKTSLST